VADVADVGCGRGASVVVLAEAFPGAEITGFDYHGSSVETARSRAAETPLDLVFEVRP
jgi:trans-aconitate methyltransferase